MVVGGRAHMYFVTRMVHDNGIDSIVDFDWYRNVWINRIRISSLRNTHSRPSATVKYGVMMLGEMNILARTECVKNMTLIHMSDSRMDSVFE